VVATVDGIAIVAAVTVVVTVDGSDNVVAAAVTVVVIVYDSGIFVVVATVTVVVTVDGSGIVVSASVAVVSVVAAGEEQMNVTSDWRHCCSYSLFASRYVFVIVPVGKIGKRNCCLDV
jgi:hypothetical protein